MVYTVTLNPSLDYTMELDGLEKGILNRADSARITAGGKGINVSRILTRLDVDNLILGFAAGFTGDEIERSLNAEGCESEFIRLEKGISRINVKVCSKEVTGVTEINAPGPEIPVKALEKLDVQLDRLKEGDYLVLAGAIPEGLPEFSYRMIINKMNSKGIRTVVDTSGNSLLSTLEFAPFLIKPNRQELGELFSTKNITSESAEKYALELRAKGAENVLVSLDREGALLATENDEIIYQAAPERTVVNPVGAGDSMLAGFLWGLIETGDYR